MSNGCSGNGHVKDEKSKPAVLIQTHRPTKQQRQQKQGQPPIIKKQKSNIKLVLKSKPKAIGSKPTKRAKGLPTFAPRTTNTTEFNDREDQNVHHHQYEQEEDDLELPCDTIIAIHSLQRESQGLHIPLFQQATTTTTNGGVGSNSVQVVLESQVFQRFQESHASTIWSELRHLIQSNQLRQLSCQGMTSTHVTTTIAYILTNDYVAGVWDAHQQQHYHQQHPTTNSARELNQEPFQITQTYRKPSEYNHVLHWFVSNLSHWTQSTFSKYDMEQYWEGDTTTEIAGKSHPPLSLDEAIRYLVRIQVLIRDTSSSIVAGAIHSNDDERYKIWLPQWGLVLKSWNEARQHLLNYLVRSNRHGEVSEANLLSENRHSSFSTKFLLDELLHQGKIRIIQRPFGKFVKRIADKE